MHTSFAIVRYLIVLISKTLQQMMNLLELRKEKFIIHLPDLSMTEFQHERRIILYTKAVGRNMRNTTGGKNAKTSINLGLGKYLITKDIINRKI